MGRVLGRKEGASLEGLGCEEEEKAITREEVLNAQCFET